MNCRRVEQVLSDHLEGLLSPRESGAVAAHLRECPACHRLREEYRSLFARMRDLAEQLPVPGPEIERRSIERWLVDQEPAHETWRSQFRISPATARHMRERHLHAAAAATLALAVLGLTQVRWQHRRASGQPPLSSVQRPHSGRPLTGPTLALKLPLPPSDPQSVVSLLRAPDRAGEHGSSARPSLAVGAEERAPGKRSLPSGQRSRQPGADDLHVLNGTPAVPLPPWRAGSPEEWGPIETRVRGAAPVRDDFVYIPFPRVVTTADSQIAAAAESYEREAAVVDTRLAREVTLAIKATALGDVCEHVRADTGIRLEAGSSVADEKVTLLCRKRPLREVMRQLSRPFGYTWLRSGKVGDYRYELVQDLRSQLLEEELRNRARSEALLALDREMQRYRPYLALSPDEALARSKSALPEEKRLLGNLAGRGWGPIQMYFRISPRDLAALRAGQPLDFAQDPRPEDQILPPDIARAVLQSQRDVRIRGDRGGEGGASIGGTEELPDGVPPTSFPEARARVRLRFGHSELGQFTFDGESGVYVGTRITIGGTEYASGTSSAVQDPKNTEAHAAWARDPALNVRVTVQPQGSCRFDLSPSPSPKRGGEQSRLPVSGRRDEGAASWARSGQRRGPVPGREQGAGRALAAEPTAAGTGARAGEEVNPPKATSADVLEALHHATGLPIAADSYTRLFPISAVSLQNATLFDALNRLADTLRLRWQRDKEGGWLQFRSVSFYDDRLKEVPNRLLSHWAASRRQHGALTLDDLIEIAGLTDVQLDSPTTAEGARDCFDLLEWHLARNQSVRPHLRYLATLTPAQLQATLTTAGLRFSQLSLAQQQQFIAHLGSRVRGIHIRSLGELSGAVVRVEYTLPGGFRWIIPETVRRAGDDRPPSPSDLLRGGMFGLSPVREGTREATLQAARRIDLSVEAAQIGPTELALAVVYMLTDPNTGALRALGVRGVSDGARISW